MQLYAIIIVVVPQKLAAPISLYMCVFFGDKLSRIIQDNSAVLTAGDGERVPSLPFPRLSLWRLQRHAPRIGQHQGLAGLRCQVSSRGQYLDERSLA